MAWIALLTSLASAALNEQETALAAKVTYDAGQKRPHVEIDATLCAVARARAADMARRNYFGHVNPDGVAANYLVRQAGYRLPDTYSADRAANNIESIAAGYTSVSEVWTGWMNSPPHKTHILALDAFYQPQTSLGVGYYRDSNSEYGSYWVIITAPPDKPTLAIASPAAGARLSSAQVAVSGATGGTPAASVRVRVENASGVGAFITASGVANWTATVGGLIAGANTLRIQSVSDNGSVLLEFTRAVRYVVLAPLIVAIEGNGSVTSGFLGTSQRELNANYSIAARPATGWLFARWGGGIESTAATLVFTMSSDLQLNAHFIPNPFFTRAGGYNGLLATDAFAHETAGFIKLTITTLGAFSGRLTLGGVAYSVAGKFDVGGDATLSVRRTKLPPLALTLHLDFDGGTDRITGAVSDGEFSAALSADRGGSNAWTGRYTVALPADPQNADAPSGSGYSTLTVSTAGVAVFSGALADGTAIAASATVSRDGVLPLYSPLYSAKGSFFASLTLPAPEGGVIAGSYRWTKPELPKSRIHPSAIAIVSPIIGSRFIAPLSTQTIPTVTATPGNVVIELTGGNLDGFAQSATLAANNRVSISVPLVRGLNVSINRTTGRFTGSFIHPAIKAWRRFDGILLQTQNAGYGFFLGADAAGSVSIRAAE